VTNSGYASGDRQVNVDDLERIVNYIFNGRVINQLRLSIVSIIMMNRKLNHKTSNLEWKMHK